MSELTSNVSVQNITVPPITTMLDHLAAANPHPQYSLKTEFPSLVATLVTLSDIRDVIVPNADISDCVLAWKDAAWRPTPISSIIDVNDLEYATAATQGVVRLAAQTDISNRNTSAVVTASGFRKFLDDNGYTDAVTQKLQVMRTPEQVISAINNGSTNVVSGMELDGGGNQYVLVTYPKFNAGDMPGLVTDDTVWQSSRCAYISSAINQNYANILVNRNGWIKDYVLRDELSSAVGADIVRKPLTLTLTEDASGYDVTIKNGNWLVVHNNAKINRLMVSSNGAAYVSGLAHDVKLVGNNEITDEAYMKVTDHGHAEYIEVSKNARIEVSSGGIIEHVQATDTIYGINCAVQILGTGKAYHVVLRSGNAAVYSGGYMEDVTMYDGAYLILKSGAIVKDLKAYQNAHISIEDGVTIDGMVRYQPTVTLGNHTTKGLSSVIEAGAVCHLRKMLICQLDSHYAATDYHVSYIQSGAGYQSAGVSRKTVGETYTWTQYSGGIVSSATDQNKIPATIAFYPDTAPTYTEHITNYSEYYNTIGSMINVVTEAYDYSKEDPLDPTTAKIWVPSFEAPKGFLRIMPEAVKKLENATAETMKTSGAELYSSAYQYHLVQSVAGYCPTGDPDVAMYTIVPPEGFFDTFNSHYEWYVTF